MSLFTVRMKRKQIVSKYDERGRKISEVEVLVDQTYHDLPYATAQSYLTRFPDNQVVIERQAEEFKRDPRVRLDGERENRVPRAERDKIGGNGTGIAGAEAARRKTVPIKRGTTKSTQPEVVGADMSTVINKVLERA